MTQQDIVTQTGYFLWNNSISIIFVVLVFISLTILIAVNGIKFEKPETKVVKEIVVEKYKNPPNLKDLNNDVGHSMANNKTCNKLKNKAGCTSLGSCVWAIVKDKNDVIKTCVEAQALGSGSTAAKGSDGPSDICHCSKNGKLLPWEEYYYLDGDSIKKKKGKPCTAEGDKCSP